jgi:hypothetical protein
MPRRHCWIDFKARDFRSIVAVSYTNSIFPGGCIVRLSNTIAIGCLRHWAYRVTNHALGDLQRVLGLQ